MFGVIPLITPKGGTGKSTLARSLAAHWSLTGLKPALVDAEAPAGDRRSESKLTDCVTAGPPVPGIC